MTRPRAPAGPAPSAFPKLAGYSDATIRAKTGRSWLEWVTFLDGAGAAQMTHGKLAKTVFDQGGVSGWWSQAVAVGYERIRGLREAGQRLTGEWVANKSRTIDASAAAVFRAFSQKSWRAKWLPGVALTVRTSVRNKSLRITWPDRTNVEVYLTPKTPKRTTVAIQHGKLASRSAMAEAKAAWTAHLASLAAALES
jgi:uncharacterized protein YndB with AHSA1/START domain